MRLPSPAAAPRLPASAIEAPPEAAPVTTHLHTVVIAPNGSLSARGAWAFVVAVGVPSVGSGLFLAWWGYWPVLVAALMLQSALIVSLRISRDASRFREVITFGSRELIVEHGVAGVGALRRWRLPRAWTRVAVCSGAHCNSPLALYLQSSGRRVRIGECLTDDERRALAARLRQWLAERVPAARCPQA